MLDAKDIIRGKNVASFLVSSERFAKQVAACSPNDFFLFRKSGQEKKYRRETGYVSASYVSYKQVTRNNAQLLFLKGTATLPARRYRNIGQAQHLFISPGIFTLLCFLPAWLIYGLRGQMQFQGLYYVSSAPLSCRYWLLFKPSRKNYVHNRRFYFSPFLRPEELLKQLSDENIRYCLLRWRDALPQWKETDDLDILAADDDINKCIGVFSRQLGICPIDLYSVSGDARSNYNSISYFPPKLAKQIIDNRKADTTGIYTASDETALLSFLFHCVYHKGYACGLKTATSEAGPMAPRYENEIKKLGSRAGLSPPHDLEGIIEFLKAKGWEPPLDAVSVYALTNPWLKSHYFSGGDGHKPGLAVFILRALGESKKLESVLAGQLRAAGFTVREEWRIPEEKRAELALHIRGGNWTKGREHMDSGLPAYVIVAEDPRPKPIRNRRMKRKYPRIDNARILVKLKIRDALSEQYFGGGKVNLIHGSDNTAEALEYIRILQDTCQ